AKRRDIDAPARLAVSGDQFWSGQHCQHSAGPEGNNLEPARWTGDLFARRIRACCADEFGFGVPKRHGGIGEAAGCSAELMQRSCCGPAVLPAGATATGVGKGSRVKEEVWRRGYG